ncbi:MAG: phosphoribosyltransferase family protein [Candidatus Helarchaeota archaeon]
MVFKYKDREEAGRKLAEEIKNNAKRKNVDINFNNTIVLSIPDEGIITGYMLTKELNVKMNLIVVGKLRIPNSDIGIGSITIDGNSVINDAMINKYRITQEKIQEIEKSELDKMIEKLETYKIAQINLEILKDKYVIIVDEGAETGYSMIGAIKSVNLIGPKLIIVALPTASFHSIMIINRYTPHIVCPNIIDSFFFQVKNSYIHYHKVDQETVLKYIEKIKKENLLYS